MTPVILSALIRAGLGALAWILVTVWSVNDLRGAYWSAAILLLAAFVLVPLVIALVRDFSSDAWPEKLLALAATLQLPAAVLLMVSSAQKPGVTAALLAAPWIGVTALLALAGGLRIIARGWHSHWEQCRDTGLVFIAVGGAWTLADRLGMHPLGFGSDIVQLTAVHFHFAGLVLPVVAGCVWRETHFPRVTAVAGWGVLAGVPLVAVGITATQLNWGHALELLAGLVLGLSGMVVAILQIKLAQENRWPLAARVLWVIAGFSLFFGMTLALLYSARTFVMPLPWLNIPWMRALHGTANALGFAQCAALGWVLALCAKPDISLKSGARRGQHQQRR
ncbi:YndJ family transporter [Oleiharenicola lentus]|uniref:YndJ family transporter n=1 Tax=Oleiharenicola lentus TaxID=2508720 RepID=UPI003F67841B